MPEITAEQLAAFEATQAKLAEFEGKAKAADDYKNDMFKYKKDAADKEAELSKIRAAQEEVEKQKLAEQGQYQKLLEKSEAEKLKYKEEAENHGDVVTRFVRSKEVETVAMKLGIRTEALPDLRLLGLDKLEVQREGNEIKVLGAEAFVTEQKKLRPHWFQEAEGPNFNKGKGATGGGGDNKLTLELFKKDPAKYKELLKAQVGK